MVSCTPSLFPRLLSALKPLPFDQRVETEVLLYPFPFPNQINQADLPLVSWRSLTKAFAQELGMSVYALVGISFSMDVPNSALMLCPL